MKVIISEKISRIIKAQKKLETKLEVKISNRGKEVTIEGSPEDEYTAEKVIDALNFGFPFSTALSIKQEDLIFEIINIKDHTKRQDLSRVRARIIGTKGKTLNTLTTLTDCEFSLSDNNVGIIGNVEEIEDAKQSIISLIQGSKQSNVYARAEKQRKRKKEFE